MKKILLFIICNLSFIILFSSSVFAAYSETDFSGLNTMFERILNIAISGAAMATFAMILMGGFGWLTSGGDPKALEHARDKITYGIAGLALMILAWFILKFIYEFTGVPVTTFEIPGGGAVDGQQLWRSRIVK